MEVQSQKLFQEGIRSYSATSYETAISLFSQAIALLPSTKVYHARSKAYEKLGRIRDALGDVREVIKLMPESHKGYLMGGKLWTQVGKWDKAERMLEEGQGKSDVTEAVRKLFTNETTRMRQLRAKAEFCPFSQLPHELFVHIISLASSSPSPSSRNTTLLCTQVCRRWYTSISSSPLLWSTLRLDGLINKRKAATKTRWWALKALGKSEEEEFSKGRGLDSLVLTRIDLMGDQALGDVLMELKRMKAVSHLTSIKISFLEGDITPASEQLQLIRLFAFLSSSCSATLRTLTLHTSNHLRLLFSLPRLGNLFPSLSHLEIRSALTSESAGDVYLPPKFLPSYEGEDDWPPTRIRTLILVGPIWRLKFDDGTIVSPEVTVNDCPELEELEIGPTMPNMTWSLFSAEKVRKLKVVKHLNNPHEVDPDLKSWHQLIDLSITSSPQLANRLLSIALTQTIHFDSLLTLDLKGARISESLLALFSLSNAPQLVEMRLASTFGDVQLPSTSLGLPSHSGLRSLDLSGSPWVDSTTIKSLPSRIPSLDTLLLRDLADVSGRSVMEYVQSRPSEETEGISALRVLDLTGCRVEEAAVEWLGKHLKKGALKYRFDNGEVKGVKRKRLVGE